MLGDNLNDKDINGFNVDEKHHIREIYDRADKESQSIIKQVLKISSVALLRVSGKKNGITEQKQNKAAESTALVTEIAFMSSISEVSFTAPFRRKRSILFGATAMFTKQPNENNSKAEVLVRYSDIKLIVCLDTPDKLKQTWTLIGFGIDLKKPVFCINIPDVLPSTVRIEADAVHKSSLAASCSSANIVCQLITAAVGVTVQVVPEKAKNLGPAKVKKSFARCYLGAKEGFLYALMDGILFGLKTPTFFLPYNRISGMEIASSGSNRTFNLTATFSTRNPDEDTNGNSINDEDVLNLDMFDVDCTAYVKYIVETFSKYSELNKKRAEKQPGVPEHIVDSTTANTAMQCISLEDLSDNSNSSEDSDFNPHKSRGAGSDNSDDESSCPEEYEENYESDSESYDREDEDDSDDENGSGNETGGERKRRKSGSVNEVESDSEVTEEKGPKRTKQSELMVNIKKSTGASESESEIDED
eukprot:CFRG0289T1